MTDADLARRISARYQKIWHQKYAASKLSIDPVYRNTLAAFREVSGPILDIGCGLGLLPFYLREQGVSNEMIGIDIDERKIEEARRIAGSDRSFDFRVADARVPLEFRGSVAMIDVLHYFDSESQRSILRNAATYAARGGTIVIRECPRDGSWRYRVTYAEEWLATSLGWLRGERLNFPDRRLIEEEISEEHFESTITPLWGSTPFNNYLFVFRSRHEAGSRKG